MGRKAIRICLGGKSNSESPGGPALPSQFTVTSKDFLTGFSQRTGEILWGYKSILKHRIKRNNRDRAEGKDVHLPAH